jgi:hypothetical protein
MDQSVGLIGTTTRLSCWSSVESLTPSLLFEGRACEPFGIEAH